MGFATHVSYLWLMQSFPLLRVLSPPFLASACLCAATHYLWGAYFLAHFHQSAHVLCFFLFAVW